MAQLALSSVALAPASFTRSKSELSRGILVSQNRSTRGTPTAIDGPLKRDSAIELDSTQPRFQPSLHLQTEKITQNRSPPSPPQEAPPSTRPRRTPSSGWARTLPAPRRSSTRENPKTNRCSRSLTSTRRRRSASARPRGSAPRRSRSCSRCSRCRPRCRSRATRIKSSRRGCTPRSPR